MTTTMRFERLEGRDVPAAFTGAGWAEGFQPFPGWSGPVEEAWGDFLGTGGTQVAFIPGAGGGPVLRVYELTAGDGSAGAGWVANRMLFEPEFRGGVNLTTAPQTRGADLIVAGAGNGGGPVVRVVALDGSVDRAFFAYDSSYRGGVYVGVSDTDGDGAQEITTTPFAGGGPHLKQFALDGTLERQFFIGPSSDQTGAYHIAPAGLAEAAPGAAGRRFAYTVDGPDGTSLYDALTGVRVD